MLMLQTFCRYFRSSSFSFHITEQGNPARAFCLNEYVFRNALKKNVTASSSIFV
jgi:hypothetical protein